MSLNLAYNNALTALDANQKAIAVHSDNVANASNVDYKKRTTVFNSNGTVQTDNLNFGSGVQVANINREFNLVLETNLLNSQSQYGYSASYAYYLNNIENFISPNGQNLIGDSMTELQSTLNSAMNNLDNSGSQIELYQALEDLSLSINNQYSEMLNIRNSLIDSSGNGEIKTNVSQINDSLNELQQINKDLAKAASKGVENNELLDRRDALLKDVSEAIDIEVKYNDNGTVNVNMPATVSGTETNILLVDGSDPSIAAEQLTLSTSTSATSGLTVGVIQTSSGDTLDISDNKGSLNGMMQALEYTDENLLSLYSFAKTVTDEMNSVAYNAYAADGSTNNNMFKELGAVPPIPESENLVEFLLPDYQSLPLWDDPSKANSADAAIIKQYQDALKATVPGEDCSVADYSNTYLTKLSLDVKAANDQRDSAQNTNTMYQNAVYDYSSVDINKEMAELMNVQSSFEAAATLMSTVNKMVNSAINMVN
ncbi:flagellar hook-associated protein FlgK [Lentisphaerota bacterium WC36G]|nr:flagellar hook-associated protein FlgK [Lentisphaerae bacterium WC36]